MSGSNDTKSQCERTTEPYGVAMGDVLAKGYCKEDKSRSESSEDSEEDSRILSERQAADGASDTVDDVSSSTAIYRLADTLEENRLADVNSENTALRIDDDTVNEHLTSAAATYRLPEHSLDYISVCPTACSEHPGSFCPCDTCKLCKLKRTMIDDELKREIRWHRLWTELRDHIRSVFEAALEATVVPNTVRYQCDPCRLSQLRENVIQMCKKNSQQLLLMLIVQAQEFVVELKNRIKETLHDHSLTNVAEIFLTRILDGYDAFVSTAKQITDLVKPVEERYLLKFNLTWEFFNKALYEYHIWMSEPSMRNVTGSFTTQLTKSRKRHSYQALFERYVAFVEEMMRVAELWPETERLIVKWNDKQTADRARAADVALDSMNVSSSSDIVPSSHDKCEGSNEIEIVENILGNSNSLSQACTNGVSVCTEKNDPYSLTSVAPVARGGKSMVRKDLNPGEDRKQFLKKRASMGNMVNSPHELDIALRHKTDIVQEMANDLSESMDREPQRPMCQCIYEHMREIDETGRTWWSDSPCLCVLNRKWLCGVSKTCPCLAAASMTSRSPNERPESPTSTTPNTIVQKQTRHSTTQTASPIPPASTDTASLVPMVAAMTTAPTTTPIAASTTHNHNHNVPHQGSTHTHFHGPPSDSIKSTGPSHRAHTHNNHASHTCHKQAKVEHIKRVLCNDLSPGDGDCSDSGSSQEDSCSTSSSTPRDSSRHCDCCYCEVFGPGVPSVAPVSRNYNEMRERLRQLLTKKKAKKCKAPCSPPKSPAESSVSSSTSVDHKPTVPSRLAPSRSNTPIPATSMIQPEQRDQRDLEALLEFIEGNQDTKKDNKKTEKKARQKQRKLDEMLKKAKEEADRQNLIELQKKTPEVTITVVDPQKPVSQRLPQRNLPEISILPAMVPPVPLLSGSKQSNNAKKKDKKQQQEKITEKLDGIRSNSGNAKSKTAMISVTPINLNVFDFVVRDGTMERAAHSSKAEDEKNDKNVLFKTDKSSQPLTSFNLGEPVSTDVKLTKKERKKLRREMKKLEEAKEKEQEQRVSSSQPENQPQIVTIKRVMESNSAEPTVTITLKGQTPAEDKVLFTLVNGQTKEPGSAKSEQHQGQAPTGKKKKGKGNSGNSNQSNGSQTQQQGAKGQQQISSSKCQPSQKGTDAKNGKQQQTNVEKLKGGKKIEEKKILQEQQHNISESKSTKSKKDKKNAESKQIVAQPTVNSKCKNTQQLQQESQKQQQQQQQGTGKKQNKANVSQQTQGNQKPQCNQNCTSDVGKKKSKGQSPQQESNIQTNVSKNKKKGEITIPKQNIKSATPKNRPKNNQSGNKEQKPEEDTSNNTPERDASLLSSQLKSIGSNSKINIENLKLPPGITITKVDAPTKSLPIKSAPMPKPVIASKQTTIIAAPMSGIQSSYPGPQTGGNVIVVDTGKLKQDLLPKNGDKIKETSKESQAIPNTTTGKKKKKKKGKSSSNGGKTSNSLVHRGSNDLGKENGDESARIVHNPGSNMVTIRNPAFGPPPKIDTTPQAAIIKVSENGMVTIRSPALQQAINAGMTPPPKPDFIVKGDPSMTNTNGTTASNRATLTPTTNSTNNKNTNGIISSSLAEFRSRLTPDCTTLPGLANIHISKVTNGQPIPERGINLRGTSVTLTKVRSQEIATSPSTLNSNASMEEVQQAKSAVREAMSAAINVPGSSKSKKKKKRGNGVKHCGDDWNLVESVFTPKDIEDGEMDDAERELEAFKRFCLQSVPPPRKEKVNLNIKDIVLKKKSSSSSSDAGAAIAAN